jgi:3'-5' exonuclease
MGFIIHNLSSPTPFPMLELLDINNILFFDIETVPAHKTYEDLDENWQYLWKHKAKSILKKGDEPVTDEEAAGCYQRAGIYAEFGKIVCISVGLLKYDKQSNAMTTRLKSYYSDDETELLRGFTELLNKHYNRPEYHYLCGHNIKEFDVPFICRRLMLHQMPFPKLLDVIGKKPWETKQFLDTMDMWKFGDHKNYTSVKLLAAAFGFPSPKDDIDGSDVARVYYEENDLERIATYCQKDVVAVMQLMLKFKRMNTRLSIDGDVLEE